MRHTATPLPWSSHNASGFLLCLTRIDHYAQLDILCLQYQPSTFPLQSALAHRIGETKQTEPGLEFHKRVWVPWQGGGLKCTEEIVESRQDMTPAEARKHVLETPNTSLRENIR